MLATVTICTDFLFLYTAVRSLKQKNEANETHWHFSSVTQSSLLQPNEWLINILTTSHYDLQLVHSSCDFARGESSCVE
jgi:hypothetical protein